ncbi:Hsp70 family protein [Streptomyces sp. MBT42]|uniref:Hsp70 family protein n=1 Tax=Streptomyces sp. MBT42 TaxID=1488373 RepID=UPI001E3D1C5F|nr:Hsp70 family protein [Streptomyces sp. MBT42]MCD2463761.1 Hsp70 family protein [Streptomyces sp. MBT42]
MHRTLGIDLGTTNSVTAWMRDGVPVVLRNRDGGQATPSAVGVGLAGDLLVGKEALNWLDGDPRSVITEVKRLIGRRWDDELVQQALKTRPDDAPSVRESPDGSVEIRLGAHWLSPVQVSAVLLRRLRKDAEDAAGVPFRRAVITVPAYFAEPQFAAVREAGRLAGFHVARILQEPTAAAHAFGVRPGEDGIKDYASVLVFDLGGGTFDVSLLTLGPGHFDVAALGGDNLLGGADFDALLDGHLRHLIGERDHDGDGDASRIRAAAERAKIELSTRDTSEVVLAPLGRRGGSWSGAVRRGDFEELLTGHLRGMRETVEAVLTGYSTMPEDVQRVLLVGGSTFIPAVRRELQDLFGEETVSDAVDPMTAVAHGAAVEAGLLDTLGCPSESCTVEGIPIDSDACPACATPLLGTATVDCPGCHVPAPELTAACPVCAADLSGLRATAPAAVLAVCPGCDRADNPAGATVCGDCDTPLDSGGLKCPGCSMVNAAGLSACSNCGGDFGTAPARQVTAQDIGVELEDGGVKVVFPGGTPYPTEWEHVDGLMIRGDDSAYVQFNFWEGRHLRSARRNEFCGGHVHHSADGLRGDLPLTLQVRIDTDRTIDLRFRIGSEEWSRAELRRSPVSSAVGRKAAALQSDYTDFLTRWAQELTHAERDALTEIGDDLAALARGERVGRSLDGFFDSGRDTLKLCSRARNVQAVAGNLARGGRGLLPTELLTELRNAAQAVKDTRETMDTIAMRTAAERAEDVLAGIDPRIRTAVSTIQFAEQGSFPAALSAEVIAARDALRSAVADGGQDARDAQLVRLGRLGEQGRSQFAEHSAPAASTIVLPSRQ